MTSAPAVDDWDALYDRTVEDLPIVVSERTVSTAVGTTHLLLAGDTANPPLVAFQGGNVTNPVTLAWLAPLTESFRVIAPDTPGEPGKSTDRRPDNYGAWTVDVLDALDLDTAAMIGVSHGGGVLLETLAHAPNRATRAGLVAPAGFGTGRVRDLLGVVVPALGYRALGWSRFLDAVLDALYTRPVAEIPRLERATISQALRTSDLTAAFPGPPTAALADCRVPTVLFAGERDPFFPADAVLPRADDALPSVETHALSGERHIFAPDTWASVTSDLREFLD